MILLHDLVGSFSVLELVWSVIALGGIVIAALNAWEALADYRALGGRQNGRRVVAIGNIRREIIRIGADVAFLGVGLYAGTVPANPHATMLGVVLTSCLVVGSLGFNLNSWLDRRDRIYLMRYGMQSRDETGRFVKDD